MPGPGGLQPAERAAVFRRGGMLRVSRRHGSHVRNVGGHESSASQVVLRRARTSASSSYCVLLTLRVRTIQGPGPLAKREEYTRGLHLVAQVAVPA